MTEPTRSRPTLACYDGSEGSRRAIQDAARVLGPRPLVVLTVWQSLATQLSHAAGFGTSVPAVDEERVDVEEERVAKEAAEEAVRSASEQGFDAVARVEQATSVVWQTIVDVADDIDAELIICGTRGRSALRTALLGSTSHGVLHNSHRPVLIAPEPKGEHPDPA